MFPSADGTECEAWFYAPKRPAGAPPPVVVMGHGLVRAARETTACLPAFGRACHRPLAPGRPRGVDQWPGANGAAAVAPPPHLKSQPVPTTWAAAPAASACPPAPTPPPPGSPRSPMRPGLGPGPTRPTPQGGQKDMGLDRYAARFAAAGLASFVFDYRTFGGSDGDPRNWISPRRHLEDWRAALGYVRDTLGAARGAVDAGRLAVWGTSYGGGHALVIAGEQGDAISAVVAQVRRATEGGWGGGARGRVHGGAPQPLAGRPRPARRAPGALHTLPPSHPRPGAFPGWQGGPGEAFQAAGAAPAAAQRRGGWVQGGARRWCPCGGCSGRRRQAARCRMCCAAGCCERLPAWGAARARMRARVRLHTHNHTHTPPPSLLSQHCTTCSAPRWGCPPPTCASRGRRAACR